MSTEPFVVISIEDAEKEGIIPTGQYVSEYRWGIFDTTTQPYTLIGMDGGAPEDQLLVRDWSWVVKALNKAYSDGHAIGNSNGYNRGYYDGCCSCDTGDAQYGCK